jgi:thioesterase domain-containing protein/aryl carrier-like protein
LKDAAYKAPRNAIEKNIAKIWRQLLGLEQVGVQDNFFELGGHSIIIMQVFSRLKELRYEIQVRELFVHQTIARQAEIIKANSRNKRKDIAGKKRPADKPVRISGINRHLMLFKSNIPETEKDNPFLFIIPGGGGRCEAFYSLAQAFENKYTLYGINMMGTEKGETPLHDIRKIATQNIKWIQKVQQKGPYRLMGHCFGGHIAYEMAAQLEKSNHKVEFVSLMDIDAGLHKAVASKSRQVDYVLRLTGEYFESANILKAPYPDWVRELRDHLLKIPLKAMLPYISDFAKSKMYKKRKAIEFICRMVNMRIVNTQMNYLPSERIEAEIILLKAGDTAWVGKNDSLGWEKYGGKIKTSVIPGNHDDMINEENSPLVVRSVAECLSPNN